MKRIAGRAALATLAGGLVVGLASLALWMADAGGNETLAQGSTTIGIDADPTGNTATALGSIQSCISADVDDTLYVDAFVTAVEDLRSFEFWVTYDPAVLNVIGRDVLDQFLKWQTPTGSIWDTSEIVSEASPDADGVYVAGAFDTEGQDDGEGVLVRLRFKVVGSGAEGYSPLSLDEVDLNSDTIPDYGSALYDNLGQPIGDTDGDNYFDGPIYNGAVVVGAALDSDSDTIVDPCDNCPDNWNPLQEDSDQDGVGDACDNCPLIPNPGQEDSDNDDAGDACDNCPLVSDPDQTDSDSDNFGNPCDCDDDNGGTPDAQEVRDGTNPLNPGDDQPLDTGDTDDDGALNWEEFWCGTDPFDDCGDDCGGAATDDAWAYDINMDCWANSTDMLMFPANVSMPAQLGVHPTYQCRYDMNGDSWINSTDMLMFPARISMPLECTP